MEITIKENDALRAVALITNFNQEKAIKIILSNLSESEFLIEPIEEVGKTIQELIEEFKHQDLSELIRSCFPELENNQEFRELFSSLLFFAKGSEFPCPDCGCEIITENKDLEGKFWEDKKCSNCQFAESNEPDWDSIRGGKDDY